MRSDRSSAGPTILVTGAAGMLSRPLVPAFAAAGWQVTATDIDLADRAPWGPSGPVLSELDVRRADDVADAIRQVRPQVVLHLAAETNLETCEADPEHAQLTNATGTLNVARACRAAGIRMVYVSTAGVYDGKSDVAYTEKDPPSPINWYGGSKAEGERYVQDEMLDYLIVRAGWMVGGPMAKDHKFVGKIVQQIRSGRTVIYAVGDKFGSPTYSPDFARTLITVLGENIPSGIYHSVSECWRSRYEIACEIVAMTGRDDITVKEVTSDFFLRDYCAPRPRSEVLRNAGLAAIGHNHMRPWPEPLAEYIQPWLAEIGAVARSR
jgi:dTDP-4-dehydrorhamnose reductase